MKVSVVPPAVNRATASYRSFRSWRDLGNYTHEISAPMSRPTKEIREKAQQIISAADTDWERMKALSEFAQNINYESISLDLHSGGGYQPRPASESLRKGYGDCKDKSALLKALLASIGIRSHLLIVNSNDRDAVDRDWPSTRYFNHCVAAIEVDDSIEASAIVEHEALGRLLIVDPTWNTSPFGEIPQEAQGGLAYLALDIDDPLLRLPTSRPEQNRIERKFATEILPNGVLVGRMDSRKYGKAAASTRLLWRQQDGMERNSSLRSKFSSSGNPSARVEIIDESDNATTDGTFSRTVEFGFKGYGKSMGSTLIVFKPAILDRITGSPYPADERSHPVSLRASMLEEENTIYLPQGYEMDEYEPRIEIRTDFGDYLATLEEQDGVLIYKRLFRMKDTTLPAGRYQELRDFYKQVIDAENTPVVLARAG